MAKEKMRLTKGRLKGVSARDAVFVIEYVKDFSVRRAAEASGYSPETGYAILKKPEVVEALSKIMDERIEEVGIDAEWVLFELVDNHRIARQQGNISASNTALLTLAKHISVDALAKQKVEMEVTGDAELIERLKRGRDRLRGDSDEVSFI